MTDYGPAGDSLTWIVPARRAVVTSAAGYQDVLQAWELVLGLTEVRERLARWYDVDEDPYDTALDAVSGWITSFFGRQQRPVAPRDAAATETDTGGGFDTVNVEVPFYLRLWKGPLRVLREEARRECPPIRWDRNTKEVRNADARFLPGDVVEFPLARFLEVCGKDEFAPVQFNGTGSFLLGTSLVHNGTSPPSVELHDNLLAMRLQLLLNAALGSFYSLSPIFSSEVCNGRRGRPPCMAEVEGSTVYGRGIVYGGQLGNPTRGETFWAIKDSGWGTSSGRNLPTIDGIAVLGANTPLTPGWGCSPFTLFLSYFMIDDFVGGDDSVEHEVHDHRERVLRDYYTERTATCLAPHAGETVNLAPLLGDITSIQFYAHEEAIIRIHDYDGLLDNNDLPQGGFLAAYHPFSGENYCPCSTPSREGQLYNFGSCAPLTRWNRWSLFGCYPHRWQIIPQNQVSVIERTRVAGDNSTGGHKIETRYFQLDQKVVSFFNMDLHTSGVQDRYVSRGDRELKPIGILGHSGAHAERPYISLDTLYSERAVPFQTFREAEGHYPLVSAARTRLFDASHDAHHPTAGTEAPGDTFVRAAGPEPPS